MDQKKETRAGETDPAKAKQHAHIPGGGKMASTRTSAGIVRIKVWSDLWTGKGGDVAGLPRKKR